MAHLLTRLSGKERLDGGDASELLEFLQVQAESALSHHSVRPTSKPGTGAFTKPGSISVRNHVELRVFQQVHMYENFSYSDVVANC